MSQLQPEPILQDRLRETPWKNAGTARLPGIGPVAPGDWLRVDGAYGAQMALRERLISDRPDQVHVLMPQALEAARELLTVVLEDLKSRPGFQVGANHVVRPDGATVSLELGKPLLTLGHLMQQDFCILQRDGDEHVLTAAILCFPASWMLAEKIGRPLMGIHEPVAEYDSDLGRRVQRLFDMVRPGHPLWRVNLLLYRDADLHQPRSEADRRDKRLGNAEFVRSERQCISRLPDTGAIVFAIHTVVVRRTDLPVDDQVAVKDYRSHSA